MAILKDSIKSLEQRLSGDQNTQFQQMQQTLQDKTNEISVIQDMIKQVKEKVDTQAIEDEKHRNLKNQVSSNTLVKLDVGGKSIKTTQRVLTMVKNSLLHLMFEDLSKLDYKPDGSVFLDRDGDIFLLVINYLRNNCQTINFKDQNQNNDFVDELAFW